MHRGSFVFAVIMLVAAVPLFAQDYGITVYTDETVYVQGESTLHLSVSGFNSGTDMNVDVHVAVLTPGGSILEIPDWNSEFRPLLANIPLPTGFDFPKAEIAQYAVSGYPFETIGYYQFAAAFTEPGTLNFVGDISFTPFEVQEGAVDGWTAGGCEIMWDHWYDYDDDLEWETDISAGASFVKYSERPDYFVDYFALPLDTCEYSVFEPLNDEIPTFLEAGDYIDMYGSPNGTLRMDKEYGDDYGGIVTTIEYGPGLGPELNESDYVVGETYRFVGYGGPDVGAFDVSVVAPEVLEVYTPDISSKPTIDRGSDLHLTWNGTGSGYIQFSIGYASLDFWTMSAGYYTCYCRFADDGDAVVPASVLSQLPDQSNPLGNLDPPEIGIYRMNITEYTATGLQHGYAVALAGITRDVALD
ncbi:MAG: hypothetical protein JW941_00220 [Candidatus Coatesbacteria bacterium]|nr:hypothetical protein [Candidatus Coatesbacteria bacterium]